MAWMYRLPRVLAVPLVLLIVALAGCALALLACSLPLLLLCLWVRRTVDDWRARRLLARLVMMQQASSGRLPPNSSLQWVPPTVPAGEMAAPSDASPHVLSNPSQRGSF